MRFVPLNIRYALRRFCRDESASLSVELILILPLLLWGFLTVITVFDVFRARNLALKANYAISDLLSREVMSIDSAYLAGVDKIFSYLTQGGDNTWVRVTQVVCTDDCTSNQDRVMEVDFSRATDGQTALSTSQMRNTIQQHIPLLPSGQWAIVVETSVDYEPPFLPPLDILFKRPDGEDKEINWGYTKKNTFVDIVVTEPRFGPKLCWTGQNGCD